MATHQSTVRMPANLALVGIAFLGLVLAIFIGTLIGNDEPKQLLRLVGVALGILFAVKLYQYVWQISLLLVFCSFNYRPTGFAFGALELSCLLGFGLALIFFWQKRHVDLPAVLNHRAFTFMQAALFVWLVYVAVHMVFNFKDPLRPGEFSSSNAMKSYFALSAPFVVLLYCARNPTGLSVKRNFLWTISQLCVVGLVVNLAIRGSELLVGRGLFIPAINATSNIFALRILAPIAMLIATVALTGPASKNLSAFRRFVYWMLLIASTGGALVSGGRVTILFGFAMVCLVLLFRRKIGLVAIAFGLGLVALVAAQFMADWINRESNPYLQRSVQVFLVEKGAGVGSIEASTNFRWELAQRALTEWQSSPRIFWFGRSTYGFGAQDERSILMFGGYEAAMRTALRRGATHNLLTDLLVIYGLVGCVLYLVAYFSFMRFLWVLRTREGLSDTGRDLALICALLSLLNLVLELVGAGSARVELIWMSIVLIAACYFGPALGPSRAEREAVRVPVTTPQVGHRRFARPAHMRATARR